MPTVTINDMTIGQTQRVHVAAYAADQTHNPSQVLDTTTALVVGSGSSSVATIAVSPDDPRAVIVSAVGAGTANLFVGENPALPLGTTLTLQTTVAPKPIDNRRIDFVSADQPV